MYHLGLDLRRNKWIYGLWLWLLRRISQLRRRASLATQISGDRSWRSNLGDWSSRSAKIAFGRSEEIGVGRSEIRD